MAIPTRQIAADAMRLLLERVSGRRSEPRHITHTFELHRRASTGPPGGRHAPTAGNAR